MIDEVANRKAWASSQKAALSACLSKTVAKVLVEEMGLYGPDSAPTFSDPSLRFVQAIPLEIEFADRSALEVSNWQDNDEFALRFTLLPRARLSAARRKGSLFRLREMTEFPLGTVDDIHWGVDERGNIQEVRLQIGRQAVWLRAGEVSEDFDGSVTVRDRDECVLIFVSEDAYRETRFGSRIRLDKRSDQ